MHTDAIFPVMGLGLLVKMANEPVVSLHRYLLECSFETNCLSSPLVKKKSATKLQPVNTETPEDVKAKPLPV
ncbi:hypothetical protein BaRGS_00002562 [Batillaria attramentaria]|uniref:Uncharacterized protein n=1 Tax=Batillaria attramentaria TaxID=370345 RepID=A0ABD0M3H9_9CAEN